MNAGGTVLWPHGGPITAPPGDLLPALLRAASRGELMPVAGMLDRQPVLVFRRGPLPGHLGERTALHAAAAGGHEGMVALLLGRGADPNARDQRDGVTPLHLAAAQGELGIVRLLVTHGARLSPRDRGGVAGAPRELDALGWAACHGEGPRRREVADYLLAHGARWSIWSAVAMGEEREVRGMIARTPAAIAWRMDRLHRRRTPLHLAVARGQVGMAATLIELGAPLEARDADGFTPLDLAALAGATELAELLLAHGAVAWLPASIGLGMAEQAERLLRASPTSVMPGGRWETLIVRAAERASGEMLELLLKHGASVSARLAPESAPYGSVGFTALHAAAWCGNLAAAAVLLRYGADVNARETRWCGTPAQWARRFGHVAVQELVLSGEIDLFEAVEFGLADRIPEIVRRDPGALGRRFGEVVACQGDGWGRGGWMTARDMAEAGGRGELVRALR